MRNKAVEIANALLKEDYDEGRAIAIATAKAQEWDENHPKDEGENPGISIRRSSPCMRVSFSDRTVL